MHLIPGKCLMMGFYLQDNVINFGFFLWNVIQMNLVADIMHLLFGIDMSHGKRSSLQHWTAMNMHMFKFHTILFHLVGVQVDWA